MVNLRGFILRGLVLLAIVAAAPAADALAGDWLTGDGKAHVRIVPAPDGQSDQGAIVWLQSPIDDSGQPRRDDKNPDAAKRDVPLLGLPIVTGLVKSDDDQWDGGRIYDPLSGKTYRCKATVSNDGKTLKLRGYIGFSLLGRTEVWTHVEPEAAGKTKTAAPKP